MFHIENMKKIHVNLILSHLIHHYCLPWCAKSHNKDKYKNKYDQAHPE